MAMNQYPPSGGDRRQARNGSSGGYSGTGYDRWSYEQAASTGVAGDTPINKIQHKFWVTKQAVTRKFNRDEDQHIVASDSELDAKLELFRSIHETTCRLQRLIERYQDRICFLAGEENALGRFLKEHGKTDKTRAGKMMVAAGKTMSYTGQQRLAIRVPLVRLYQEVDTFRQRAIEDTGWTVKDMEKVRTEYRGALMWMKNVSSELDPDTFKQLEKFRKVQFHVKTSKAKFDRLKLDCLQKIDLLAASRCNMFSHALIMYQNNLIKFWEKTSKTMSHVNNGFKGYQYYEFSYIKDLAEPSKELANQVNNQSKEKHKDDGSFTAPNEKDKKDDMLFFDSEYKDNVKEDGKDVSKAVKAKQAEDVSKDIGDGKDNVENAGSSGSLHNLLDLSESPEPLAPQLDDDDEILLNIDNELGDLGTETGDMASLLGPGDSMRGTSKPLGYGLPQDLLSADQEDSAALLDDLLSKEQNNTSGFSAEWSAMFDNSAAAGNGSSQDDGFSGFDLVSRGAAGGGKGVAGGSFVSGGSMAGGSLLGTSAQTKQNTPSTSAFLPSQLFEINQQNLHSQLGGTDQNLLGDFPMAGPPHLATPPGKKAASKAKSSGEKDMSQWFSLFADLDPLANPDAVGAGTQEEERNC